MRFNFNLFLDAVKIIGVAFAVMVSAWAFKNCSSIPERELHACFDMVQHRPGIWSGSTSPDSAKIATCFRFHRQEIIFKICGVSETEDGQWIVKRKPVYKYEKGNQILTKGSSDCSVDKIKAYIGDRNQ